MFSTACSFVPLSLASSRGVGDSVKGAKTLDSDKDSSSSVPGHLTSSLAVPAGTSSGPRADGEATGDDNTPAWRRGGSLRTKAPTCKFIFMLGTFLRFSYLIFFL